MSTHALAIYAVTEKGIRLGRQLAEAYDGKLFAPDRLAETSEATGYASLSDLVAETFSRYPAHVFIGACGIAVRAIAPHVGDKRTDPAVVCLDDAGRFAVSLLSGHLGGANDLTRNVAATVGATPVVTTATDAAGAPAIELLARDLRLPMDNAIATRRVNAALAAGKPVAVFDPLGVFTVTAPQAARFFEWVSAPAPPDRGTPLVVVDWRLGPETADRLYLRPRVLVAGVGCRRDTPAADILSLVARVCRDRGLALKSVGLLASIEAKRDEPGLLEAATTLDAGVRFFSASELTDVPAPNPSAMVVKHMGVGSVCEAAAILASGGGRLLAPKTRTNLSTVALALGR
ncbi:MAG: cobalt-precorrin 5A hydrolase [Solidesulfovibrio sp.]